MKKIKAIRNIFSEFKNSETRRNTFFALFGNLVYSLLGFIGIALLARSLPLSDYGGWIIYLTASSLLEMMRSGFLHTALVRFSSGSDIKTQNEYIASSWVIGLVFTFCTGLLVFLLFVLLEEFNIQSSYHYFLKYYPLLALASLPISIAGSILQFKMHFGKMIKLRLLTMTLNLIVFIAAYFLHFSLETLIVLHLFANVASSIFFILIKWSGIELLKYFKKEKIRELAHFGKYTLGTLIGTNLLKSSDTFILAFVSSSSAAALYSVPLKLTEVFEIMLRAIVSVALPKLSDYSVKNQLKDVKRVFQDYSGLLTFVYIPVMFLCFIFAEFLLGVLGGSEFKQMEGVFRVFCFYGLLLPIDRFTGVTLDCLNLPKYNFIKILAMVTFNICFNFLVLHFTSDLKYIALGTVLTTSLGIVIGIKFLNSSFQTSIGIILQSGYFFIKRTKVDIHRLLA